MKETKHKKNFPNTKKQNIYDAGPPLRLVLKKV